MEAPVEINDQCVYCDLYPFVSGYSVKDIGLIHRHSKPVEVEIPDDRPRCVLCHEPILHEHRFKIIEDGDADAQALAHEEPTCQEVLNSTASVPPADGSSPSADSSAESGVATADALPAEKPKRTARVKGGTEMPQRFETITFTGNVEDVSVASLGLEETCPCGATLKISTVNGCWEFAQKQINTWRLRHACSMRGYNT